MKGKRWVSDDSKECSRNLQGSSYSRQCGFGDRKVIWWAVVARGRFGVLVQPENRNTSDDLVWFLEELEKLLAQWFPGQSFPRVLMSDRGLPMFVCTGYTTKVYRECLEGTGFRTFVGLGGVGGETNGQWQPAAIADILIHETSIGWFKRIIGVGGEFGPTTINETHQSFKSRVSKAVNKVNLEYNINDLCRSFPRRVKKLADANGEKLKY